MSAIYSSLKQLPPVLLFLAIGFCSLAANVMAQSQGSRDDGSLSLPTLGEVEWVTIEPGGIRWHTPESLLKLLPRFVASQGVYLEPKFAQRGTIVLKGGGVLHWIAADRNSIELQTKRGPRLFVLPAECSLTVPEKSPTTRLPESRIFHHTGNIYISNSSTGSAIALAYMPLEDKLDRPNAPGISAEFKCLQGRASTTLSLNFWSTRRLKEQPLALLADGRLLEQIILNKPTDASLEDLGLIVYTIDLQRSVFLEMIEAKTVQLTIGQKTFTLSDDHLEALRDLASRMER